MRASVRLLSRRLSELQTSPAQRAENKDANCGFFGQQLRATRRFTPPPLLDPSSLRRRHTLQSSAHREIVAMFVWALMGRGEQAGAEALPGKGGLMTKLLGVAAMLGAALAFTSSASADHPLTGTFPIGLHAT